MPGMGVLGWGVREGVVGWQAMVKSPNKQERAIERIMYRVIARHLGPGPVTIGDIPSDERPLEGNDYLVRRDFDIEQSIRRALTSGLGLKEIKKLVEETTIRVVLEDQEGNLQRAARVLDVTDRTLQKRRADQLRDLQEMVST